METKKEIMKPTPNKTSSGQNFPLVDYHFHSTALGGFSGPCIKESNSFREISRDYFANEANLYFLREAAVFGTLILTAVVPIVSGAFAVIELCRAVAF
jgi:hypothetical protein